MTEAGDIVKKQTHTRFWFSMCSLFITAWLLKWGDLSDGGEVAAFGFLGPVALGFGIAKFSQYWRNKED